MEASSSISKIEPDLTGNWYVKLKQPSNAKGVNGLARTTLEPERPEVDRLRSELSAIRTRADHFATLSDELRTQW